MSRKLHTLICLVSIVPLFATGCARGPFAPATGAGGVPAQGANAWNAPPNPAAGTLPPAGVPAVTIPGQATAGQTANGYPVVPPLPPAGNGLGGYGQAGPSAGQLGGGGYPPAGSTARPPAATQARGSLPENLRNPGTVAQQQQQAQRFDPYSDNDAGPEIVGGRPRGFQKPLAEPVRAKGFRDTRWPF